MVSSAVISLMIRNDNRKIQKARRQHLCKLVYLRMTLRDRYKLHSKALLKNVSDRLWYTLYANGDDSDFVAATSLTRASFEKLLGAFELFYIFKSGPQNKKGGRSARVKDHHCVLGLLLHVYRSSGERMIFTEMFGISPTTLDRTLLKGEEALLKALDYLPEAVIEWPSHELQVELARKVQRKEPLIMGRWGFADGKNYPVQTPSNSDIQNGLYNGLPYIAEIKRSICFFVAHNSLRLYRFISSI